MGSMENTFTASGATKATNIEIAEFQESVLAKRICEIPTDLQMRTSYDSDGNAEYIGYGARSIPESANGTTVVDNDKGWLIHKFTYVSSQMTKRQTAFGSWTNRASLTYA